MGRPLLRHPRRAVPDGQDRPDIEHPPDGRQVPRGAAARRPVLPLPLRRVVPPAEPGSALPGGHGHGRHRRLHLHPSVRARPGHTVTPALPGLPRRLRGRVRISVHVRGHPPVYGGEGRAAHRVRPDAPARRRGRRARGAGGRGGTRTAGSDSEAGDPGSHRGHGDPVPGGPRAPLLRPSLPEPQGGRGVPPGRRRAGVGRRLTGRGGASPPPRVCARRRIGGSAPDRRRHRRGALPGLARQRGPRRLGLHQQPGRGRRAGPAGHGAGPQRHHARAGRQDQPLHALLRQRRAAQARRAGQHGRARHRALRDGGTDGLSGLARRPDRPGQPRPVRGPPARVAEPRRAAPRRVGGHVHRPRPLQAGERPGRPFGGRRRPQRDGQPADRHDPRGRRGGSLRW